MATNNKYPSLNASQIPKILLHSRRKYGVKEFDTRISSIVVSILKRSSKRLTNLELWNPYTNKFLLLLENLNYKHKLYLTIIKPPKNFLFL